MPHCEPSCPACVSCARATETSSRQRQPAQCPAPVRALVPRAAGGEVQLSPPRGQRAPRERKRAGAHRRRGLAHGLGLASASAAVKIERHCACRILTAPVAPASDPARARRSATGLDGERAPRARTVGALAQQLLLSQLLLTSSHRLPGEFELLFFFGAKKS